MAKKTRQYNRIELISLMKDLADKLGKVPSARNWKATEGYPSNNQILREFGTWNNGLKASGFIPHAAGGYSYEDLKVAIEDYIKEFDKLPTMANMNANPEYPNVTSYLNLYGSWNNALVQMGFAEAGKRIYRPHKDGNYIKLTNEERELIKIKLKKKDIETNQIVYKYSILKMKSMFSFKESEVLRLIRDYYIREGIKDKILKIINELPDPPHKYDWIAHHLMGTSEQVRVARYIGDKRKEVDEFLYNKGLYYTYHESSAIKDSYILERVH